jgi:outer membrane protein OmpA-like peptidoglycan-associated protein
MNRLCAAAQRIGSCAFVLIVFGLAQSAFPLPATAGESGEDEVSIGTFTLSPLQSKQRRDAPGSALENPPERSPVTSTSPAAPGEGRTLDLFEDALAALDAGRNADAQRLFERLVAEAPDSALAKEARGHLAELYQGASRSADAERGPAAAARDGETTRQRPITGSPKLGGSAAPAEPDRSRGTEVTAAIEEQFIAQAGDRVFFSAGSAELGSRARSVLQAQARFIKLRPDLAATIEGHADDGPLSGDEHVRLSETRAEAVRQRLIEEGIESHRLAVSSWGRDKKVSDCPEPACAAQNRRAVTVLFSARARRTDGPADAVPAAEVVARDQSLLTH